MNSQYVRVTRNHIRSDNVALYVTDNYGDPRHVKPTTSRWESTDTPTPTHNIELDHNNVETERDRTPDFGILPWGNLWKQAPDQRQVAISHIYIHDNDFSASPTTSAMLGCYCAQGHSPVSRVRFANNTWGGGGFGPPVMTDSHFDFPYASASTFQNPGFESTGEAWWTTVGNAAATTDATPPAVPHHGSGRNQTGYVRSTPRGPSELFQGLGLAAGRYLLSVSARVRGRAALFARDTCTGTTVAEKRLVPGGWRSEQLAIRLPASCQDVQIGVRAGSGRRGLAWAMIDNASLTSG